jgi:O-antigen ligase
MIVTYPSAAYRDINERMAVGATLLLPIFLVHARSFAEIALVLIGLCYVVHCTLTRDWRWLRTRWVVLALVWWAWVVICSIPWHGWGPGGKMPLMQSLAMLRYFVFAAALANWVLRAPRTRDWLAWMIAAVAVYIIANVLFQLVTGVNFYGDPRYYGIELTGPWDKPRAGGPLSRILLPVTLPLIVALVANRRLRNSALALGVMFGSLGVLMLIGQRMPVIVAAFALLLAALLLPRLRKPVLLALLGVAVLTALLSVVWPDNYHRQVAFFIQQLRHFSSSHYGLIYVRAVAMVLHDPIMGVGFDAFRYACDEPRFFMASLDGQPDGGGAAICVIHAHNFYLQAASDAGVPGLLLFAALTIAWIAEAGRGLPRLADPRRIALFSVTIMSLWPVAATNSFATMPMSGWFFLLLGWALAEARAVHERPV